MNAVGYSTVWKKDVGLDSLNLHIHDGVPLDELAARGRGVRDLMFDTLYPIARPRSGATVLEFGSGVGWIMQALLDGFPIGAIVGLDISANMAGHGRKRFPDRRATFVVYDGFTFPFPDGRFDTIYSCSAIHHVEKHVAFLLFREMYRVLAPGGHAVLQFLSVHHIPRAGTTYDVECWNHVKNAEVYWHHYYAYDELVVLFAEVIGVDELDVQPAFGGDCFFVHFGKGTGRRFRTANVPELTYPARLESLRVTAPTGEVPTEAPSPVRERDSPLRRAFNWLARS